MGVGQISYTATSKLWMDGEVPQAPRYEATDPGLGWILSNWLFLEWSTLCMRLLWLFPLMHNLGWVWCGFGVSHQGLCKQILLGRKGLPGLSPLLSCHQHWHLCCLWFSHYLEGSTETKFANRIINNWALQSRRLEMSRDGSTAELTQSKPKRRSGQHNPQGCF